MTTRLYLTRHGETDWNVIHRMQGSLDSSLTDLGVRQAKGLKTVLDAVSIDLVYTSPSPRAIRTAEILRGDREVPIESSESLMEMSFGIWEGCLHSEVQAKHPREWESFWNDPDKFAIQDGETYMHVRDRVLALLDEIVRKHAGKTLLIVSHTIVIKLLLAHVMDIDLKLLWKTPEIRPTSLSIVDVRDSSANIVLHADTSHYADF